MRRALLALCLVGLPLVAYSQATPLKLPSFSHLQQKATEVVDVTIGSLPLGIASMFMDDKDADDAQVKAVLKDLKSIQVRSYKFDEDMVYSKSEIESIRSQLTGDGWSQLVQVRNSKEREDVDVFINMNKEKVTGFVVVAVEPREFTIVNLVGSIDLKQLGELQKRFNLPASVAQVSDERVELSVP